jgi:hypothetical protein
LYDKTIDNSKTSDQINTHINNLTRAYNNLKSIQVNLREDAGGAVRVFVKAKPGLKSVTVDSNNQAAGNVKVNYVKKNDKDEYENTSYGPFYNFFDDKKTNADVYDSISSMINQVKQGYHIALFGYGYSGSGKTYTLLNYDRENPEKNGIVFQFIKLLEERGKIKLMKVFELYSKDIQFTTPNVAEPLKMSVILGSRDITLNSDDQNYSVNNQILTTLNNNFSTTEFFKFSKDLENKRKEQKRIKVTKNNPSSSRGHLFMTFEILIDNVTGYMTVCDMGGRENPLEILKKTEITLDGFIKVADEIKKTDGTTESVEKYYNVDGKEIPANNLKTFKILNWKENKSIFTTI